METLAYIHWDMDPEIFSIGPVTIRWYGLLFAMGFVIGQQIMFRIFKTEGKKETDVEILTFWMVGATVLGARLGHCLFYQPDIYLADPIKILYIWEGGLASHGAAAGILAGLWFYARSRPDQSYLWILDRIVITVALAGGFIRLGNLMNSEIIGIPTQLPWAFVFEAEDLLPRHPAQLYEALSCFLLFAILLNIYGRYKEALPPGRIFGIFLIWIFGLRFVYEFLKENQVAFEDQLDLNMGQILSIPLVLIGVFVLWRSHQLEKNTDALAASKHDDPT